MIYYLSPRGHCAIEHYISGRWRQTNCPGIQTLFYEDLFSRRTLPSGTWIFSAVEQLSPAGKRLADSIWQALTGAGQTVLNRPKLLPSRHALLDTMYRAGINQFRSHLPGDIDESLAYPVFVREAEQHIGNMSRLIANRKDLESFLFWQRLRGYKTHELLVVEFCDTANELGEYRKYSAQYVGGDVSARYLHVDTQWMVKAGSSNFQDEWALEERELIGRNEHVNEVKKIFELAQVEYGRIDYGMLDGRLQVWEINTNPTIGRPPDRIEVPQEIANRRQLQEPGKKLFFERFQSMLESIDSPHDPEATVALELSELDVRIWRKEVRAMQRILQRRKMLSRLSRWPPFKRVADIAKNVLQVPPW